MVEERSASNNKVEFRLKEEAIKALEKRAESGQLSRSEMAKQLLLAVLQDDFRAHFRQDLEALHQQVADLRTDLTRLVTLLLVNVYSPPGGDPAEKVRWEKAVLEDVRKVMKR